MKCSRSIVCAIALLGVGPALALAGDLNPPPGPIAPTMSSLDTLEPRVCVNDLPGDALAAHVISAPGSYYLRSDIIVDGRLHGIRIDTDPAAPGAYSIDLNGFSISSTSPQSLNGISCVSSGNTDDVRIYISRVSDSSSIVGFGAEGMRIENVRRCVIEGVSVEGTGGSGIRCKSVVKFKAGSELSGKVNIAAPGGSGLDLEDCESVEISGLRLSGGLSSGVRMHSPLGVSSSCVISDTESSGNAGAGIEISDCPRVTATGVSTTDNTGVGFAVVYQPGQPVYGNITFDRCVSSGNGLAGAGENGDGFSCVVGHGRCAFGRCVAVANGGTGFDVSSDVTGSCSVEFDRCESSSNGAAGNPDDADGFAVSSFGIPGQVGSRCVVRCDDCVSTGNAGSGCRLHGHHDVAMNSIRNMKAIANGGGGIDVNAADNASSACATLEGCVCNGNGAQGIAARVQSFSCVGGRCEGNALQGMSLTCDAVEISDSLCFTNGSDGVRVNGSLLEEHCKKNGRGLRVHCNGGDGLNLTDCDLDVERCEATNNMGAGMRCVGGRVRCADGSCRSNMSDGCVLTGTESSSFERCDFSSNTGHGLHCPGGNLLVRADRCRFDQNQGSGLRHSGDNPLYQANSQAGQNVLHGIHVGDNGGGVCGSTSHFLRCSTDNNGLDGMRLACAAGGEVTECSATGNNGAGIRVGTGPLLQATGLRLDRCYASFNAEGIVVDDAQNVVLRCTAAHNASDNMRVHAENFAGPDTDGGYVETKPYAWP